MTTSKLNCDLVGKKHEWKERTVWYGYRSTQSVGTDWRCAVCGAQAEKKPTH